MMIGSHTTELPELESFDRGVVVFQLDIQQFAPRYEQDFCTLSEEEQRRAQRYRNEVRRNAFVASRAAVRAILGALCGQAPHQVVLATDAGGKPRHIVESPRRPLQFNASHSGNIAVIAVTRLCEIGVDVEVVDRRVDAAVLMRQYFNAAERSAWLATATCRQEAAFLRAWTRKEATWKRTGDEKIQPWSGIEVSFEPDSITDVSTSAEQDLSQECVCYSWTESNYVGSATIAVPTGTRPQFRIVSADPDWLDVFERSSLHRRSRLESVSTTYCAEYEP